MVSNIGYVTLAAAARAGVPSLAFGSVNWRDVLEHYCRGVPGIDDILARIGAAYRGAGAFLRLAPGMPMPGLVTREVAAPILAVAENRRFETTASGSNGRDGSSKWRHASRFGHPQQQGGLRNQC